jgi:penicillin-binding protein 1C
VRFRRGLLGAAVAVFAAAAAGGAWCILPLPALDRSRDLSVLVLARDFSILRGFLTSDDKWRLPLASETVDPLYRRMLIAAEDGRFDSHPGVDPAAMLRAIGQLVAHRHIVSGASTVTMQTVRLLERRPRSLMAKLVEMAEALGLERRLGKDGILALYASLAPFGGNLEGIRAASLAYFGKEPTHLSAAEAALLVALPRSPERLRPDRHPDSARAARDRVLLRMAEKGIISAQILAEAQGEPVPTRRLALPFHAPHLARMLRDAAPGAPTQRTTIDPLLQHRLETLLHREAAALDPSATLAAIVVDNRERRVLAHVGTAVFGAPARRGTLDMTRAVRSPGSALKPFIYGMAFDRLILHPETLIDDRRRHFGDYAQVGDYAPGDFDGNFQGEVSAREALQYSLNVPAVAVLERLGPSRLIGGLAAAGIRLHLPRRAQEPGLAIALGGAGITLTDLATLYAGLADGGRVATLRYRDTDPPEAGVALLGRVAAWYVNDILAGAPAPPGMAPAEIRRGRKLSFKTGTSYGFRDAWAVGYDRDVTIAVWAGRPDGTPVPGSSGRLAAAPVLFKIADLLSPPALPAIPMPEGALIAARRDLPPGLQRFAAEPPDIGRPNGRNGADPAAPKILYPPDGSVVAWTGQDLPLEAVGGSGQLRWLVDDRPLPPGRPRRPVFWRPVGPGFIRLTVIDGIGRSTRATVRLMP